jgi:hypothetical protein
LHRQRTVRDTIWSGEGSHGRMVQRSRTVHRHQTLEKRMKLVKTSAIALALSALLVGPVLAQGAASDTQTRGGAQGRSNMQNGTPGSGDEELNEQAGAAGEKTGVKSKSGSKGTVGSSNGTPKSSGGATSDPATGSKRY